MKLLIDTNIVLDVLCNRKDFVENSSKVFKLCETKKLDGYLSAISVPNIAYILRKELSVEKLKSIIVKLNIIFSIIELKPNDLILATDLDFNDYEDALQSVCAKRIKADFIITRNTKDFKNSQVKAITPEQLLEK
jgi:predicted nucleic acid-binding protein